MPSCEPTRQCLRSSKQSIAEGEVSDICSRDEMILVESKLKISTAEGNKNKAFLVPFASLRRERLVNDEEGERV